MKTRAANNRTAAMTLVEVLVVLCLLLIVVASLLPGLATPKRVPQKINCVSNLKQIGIAYRLWEGDHDGKYPASISTTNGGAMEPLAQGNVAAGFLVMSNELSTPKILWCSADTLRVRATNFYTLNNSNVSYFIGLDADERKPQMFLSGDDNFVISNIPVNSGRLELSASMPIAWSPGRHNAYNTHFWTPARDRVAGNIGLADGSVQQVITDGLQKALQQTGIATNRLVLP